MKPKTKKEVTTQVMGIRITDSEKLMVLELNEKFNISVPKLLRNTIIKTHNELTKNDN